jgi:hypothetical protein
MISGIKQARLFNHMQRLGLPSGLRMLVRGALVIRGKPSGYQNLRGKWTNSSDVDHRTFRVWIREKIQPVTVSTLVSSLSAVSVIERNLQMADDTIKSKLVALLNSANEEQRAFIAGLSDSQRSEVGTSERWSVKDNLAHIVFWQQRQVQVNKALVHGETLPPEKSNQTIFEEWQDRSWSDVLAAIAESNVALLALLESYSEADLTTPDRLPPPRERPLWRYILSNGYVHPMGHYADCYLDQGDLARAAVLQQKIAKESNAFADLADSEWHGIADYNLACFYAKTGQKSLAFELLPGALKLAPSLVEWSKEDPDLVPLHNDPEYRALYT